MRVVDTSEIEEVRLYFQVILKVYEMVTGAYMSMYNRRLTLIFLLLGIDKLDACQVLKSM